jgi:hypothetical protein
MTEQDLENRVSKLEDEVRQLKQAIYQSVLVSLNTSVYVASQDKKSSDEKMQQINKSIEIINEIVGPDIGENQHE